MTCTQEQFLNRVKDHRINVLRDDGLYRHVRFKPEDTGLGWFDLITWHGCLSINGDMGTYVFSCSADMFEFFRSSGARINPGYWAEKVRSVDRDRSGGINAFDTDKLIQVVNQHRLKWVREKSISKDARRELWEKIDHAILSRAEDGNGEEASIAAQDFYFSAEGKFFYFEDWFDHSFNSHSYRYLWCCHAIAWGIAQYDAHKAADHDHIYWLHR